VAEFDILLPFYGPSGQFEEAVRSVLAQTHTDFRLLCVDDHYPSLEPRDWLLSLDDPRIEYVRNERNLGVAGNFAHCLSLAEADWFVMMGGDDVMLPNYLETVARRLRARPDVDIVQLGVEVIDATGEPSLPLGDRVKALVRPRTHGETLVIEGERMAASLARADWAYFPSIAWRTATARRHGFDTEFAIALDLSLLLDIALGGGRMLVADDRVFRYRRHAESASATGTHGDIRFAQEAALLEAYAVRFRDRGWGRAARVAHRRIIPRLNAASAAMSALVRGHGARALRYARHALA
jgi:glycosyltransferase involved in cell wall biosynthesis